MSRAERLFDELEAAQREKKLPPVDKWHPEREDSIDIRIAADGRWYHEGREIERQAMVRLFATILRRDGDEYCLVTPAEKLVIEVEDVPFLAIDMEHRGSGESREVLLTTNVGDHVVIDAEHPLRLGGSEDSPRPYVLVRDGLEALVNRAVYYRLVDLTERRRESGRDIAGIWSRGTFFPLGEV